MANVTLSCRLFVIVAALVTGRLGFAADALPVIDLSKIADADLDVAKGAWSATQTEEGISFRSILKGQTGKVLVKAWWDNKNLRPPEDTVYVLEVKYKDTNKSPVIFLTHGANGGYYGPTEVHRFGGEADGKWKTANLPFGWDQIIRMLSLDPAQEKYDQTAFLFQAPDADLPIASLSMRIASPADESGYNAATRAWVAKVQSTERQKNAPKLEPRRFKVNGDENQPVVAFTWPSMLTLMPEAQPKDDQVGATLKIRSCINELEPGSFGVYANNQDLTNLDYTVSEFKDDQGNAFKGEIIRRTAEYCMAKIGDRVRLIPERFWPAYKTNVTKGQSQWLWFNVKTIRNQTKPGLYKGTVTIACDQGTASLPVELEVLSFDLPTMEECGFCAGGCLGGQVALHDVAFQATYNQNAASFFYTSSPTTMTAKNGKLEIDFRYMDDWYAGAKKRGCQAVVYFCGGDPYGFPETLHILRDFSRMDKQGEEEKNSRIEWGKKQDAAPESILPEQRPLFKEWVKLMNDHAKAANWPEWIPSPFDEPAKWAGNKKANTNPMGTIIGNGPYLKPFFKDVCAAIHEVDPKIRIYASIHHNRVVNNIRIGEVFIPDVDVFCTNAIFEDTELGDKVRAANKTFWQYTGAGSGAAPDRARYSFGFFFGTFNSRGGLVWAYNMGGWDTSDVQRAMYAWQTPFDTIPSPWFEGYREGWDDRRVTELFKKTFSDNPEKLKILAGINAEILKEMKADKQKGGRDTVNDFWNAIEDISRMDVWRNRLLDELVKTK
jgi:hypothetical protein